MKATPDDPRLSAYLLGELSAAEAEGIRRQLAADPALRLSLRELQRTIALLDDAFGGDRGELHPNQREAVIRAAREEQAGVVELKSGRAGHRPWLAGLAAAAAVVLLAVLIGGPGGMRQGGGSGASVGEAVALLPLPGPERGDGGSATGVAADGALVAQREALEARPSDYLAEVARMLERSAPPPADRLPLTGALDGFRGADGLRLPVLVGTASYRWVEAWIREKNQLPPRDAVRVEEIVNAWGIGDGADCDGLAVAVRAWPCPWSPGSTLVAVQVQAGQAAVPGLQLGLSSDKEARLIASYGPRNSGSLPGMMPPKRRTLVLVEFRGVTGEADAVTVRRAGRPELVLHVGSPEGAASAVLRHVGLMAGFGLWLRGEQVDEAGLRDLLDGVDASDSDPVREDARRLVREALALVEERR